MRSVFTIDLPVNNEGIYSDNHEVLKLLRSFGWEPAGIRDLGNDETAKEQKYKESAEVLFRDMPEIAVEEKDYVIFFGFLADTQTKFAVTRTVEGQITFRLLHPVLPRLQSSTRKMVRKIIASRLSDKQLEISNQSIVIYERGFDHIILSGRVIPSAVRETIRTDRKDMLLFVGPLLFLVPLAAGLVLVNPATHRLLGGTLERMSTALLTTSLVSLLGLIQNYYEIRRNRLIAWTFTIDPTA